MSPDEIRSLLRRQPFMPFRVHVTGSVFYDITNPEFMVLGRTVAFIGVRRDPSSLYFDEPVMVALRHITRMEPLTGSEIAASA